MCKKNILRYLKYKLFIVVALLFTSHSFADTLLNGIAIHSELGKDRFIAGLSTSSLSSDSREILLAAGDKQIQVRILASRLSARSFKRMWIEGMAINSSSAELTANAQNMADFSNMLKIKLIAGDIFTISRQGESVNVILNGTQLGEISSTVFFDLLLRTWIGPVPLSSNFRDDLLVAGNIDDALLSQFDSTLPSDERIAAVQNAVESQPEPVSKVAAAAPAIDVVPDVGVPAPPAIAAPAAVGAAAAKPDIPAPAPQPVVQTPTPAPAKPKPTPVPVQQALLNTDLVEEEEDDFDFTAESLLGQQLYIAKLKKWTYKYIEYPRRALERSWQGNVRLSVTVDRSGAVQEVVVIEESKHSTLTKAAVKATKKASPFPGMPKEISGNSFTFTLPVVFKLN